MKRERKSLADRSVRIAAQPRATAPGVQHVAVESPDKVYRFFKDSIHADALASGKVWLSTLETCRTYEDPLQGDPHEATHEYNSGYALGGSNDEAFKLIAARSGIHIGPGCSNITINNCTAVQKLPDAYVLCTTEHFKPENLGDTFGRYCVEITNPPEFFRRLTAALSRLVSIQQGAFGRVIYQERRYVGLQDPPGPIGFVKPPDRYQDQREVRFLWTLSTNAKLDPFLLDAPDCAGLCRRIA